MKWGKKRGLVTFINIFLCARKGGRAAKEAAAAGGVKKKKTKVRVAREKERDTFLKIIIDVISTIAGTSTLLPIPATRSSQGA